MWFNLNSVNNTVSVCIWQHFRCFANFICLKKCPYFNVLSNFCSRSASVELWIFVHDRYSTISNEQCFEHHAQLDFFHRATNGFPRTMHYSLDKLYSKQLNNILVIIVIGFCCLTDLLSAQIDGLHLSPESFTYNHILMLQIRKVCNYFSEPPNFEEKYSFFFQPIIFKKP